MSISSLSVSRVMPTISKPNSSSSSGLLGFSNNRQMSVIECSSRPQKKGTAHHMKTRPKKSQPWDIKRKPTVYPSLPALPPDWTLVTDGAAAAQDNPNNTIVSTSQEQESE